MRGFTVIIFIFSLLYIIYNTHVYKFFSDNMDFKFRIILHTYVYFILLFYFVCIFYSVQCIDLDFRSIRYIKMYIVIIYL